MSVDIIDKLSELAESVKSDMDIVLFYDVRTEQISLLNLTFLPMGIIGILKRNFYGQLPLERFDNKIIKYLAEIAGCSIFASIFYDRSRKTFYCMSIESSIGRSLAMDALPALDEVTMQKVDLKKHNPAIL